jgi:SNF2 family DNA or RNA helicase
VELDDEFGAGIRAAEAELGRRLADRYRRMMSSGNATGSTHELMRLVAQQELDESKNAKTGENVFTMVRKIGQAKAGLAADYAAQLARSVGKVVFFAKHIDVMDQAERAFSAAGLKHVSIRGDQTTPARQVAIDAFNEDESVAVAVCSLTAAGVGLNLQASSNVVLAELSWTSAEQTQAIDRVHRIGQEVPVTAWRIIAAQTIDAKIAELIDSKQGLASRALEGIELDAGSQDSVALDALIDILARALSQHELVAEMNETFADEVA